MIKRDILEKRAKIVYLGIGSNLGNKLENIKKTKIELFKNNIKIIESSSYYESLSWPNIRYPKFLNIVLKIKTNLDEINLLHLCKKIEKKLGRIKTKKNCPRKCDIDIIDYDHRSRNCKSVVLPHPRMHKRNFVLIPLFELNKNWVHPKTKQHIKSLIFSLSINDITSIKQI